MQISMILAAAVFAAMVLLLEQWSRGRRRREVLERLERSFGKAHSCTESEHMKEIGVYEQLTEQEREDPFRIDDVTWQDLDMDRIFQRLNHTLSFAGEQVLYDRLRHPDAERLEERERRMTYFDQQAEARAKAWQQLVVLRKETVNYYIPEYVSLLDMQRFPLMRLCQLLLASLLGLTAAAVWSGSMLIAGLAVMNLLINIAIYAVEKIKYEVFLSSMSGIIGIVRAAGGLLRLEADRWMSKEEYEQTAAAAEQLKKVSRMMMGLENKKYSGMSGEVLAVAADYLIGALMWDFITYDRIVRQLKGRQKELMRLYRFVGGVDADIAAASWRRSLPLYCRPQLRSRTLAMEELGHPLMQEPVRNSLVMERPMIITGSNASGKSSFVKAVAVNLILGQTLNTCTAGAVTMPRCMVLTSMAVRDDILGGESYYVKEIRYLKRMVERASCGTEVFFGVDEILKGTNTAERLAASAAILRYLQEKGSMVMTATHDLELAQELDGLYDNYYFCDTISGSDILFDYKLKKGICSSRNAIWLLRSMGFPQVITDEAERRCGCAD